MKKSLLRLSLWHPLPSETFLSSVRSSSMVLWPFQPLWDAARSPSGTLSALMHDPSFRGVLWHAEVFYGFQAHSQTSLSSLMDLFSLAPINTWTEEVKWHFCPFLFHCSVCSGLLCLPAKDSLQHPMQAHPYSKSSSSFGASFSPGHVSARMCARCCSVQAASGLRLVLMPLGSVMISLAAPCIVLPWV